jgi:non-lysosomal glucosylceramidase
MKHFIYSGAKVREISFPLGGIGSGCIGLGGMGHLIDWEIFNRPAKGSRNGFSHFSVKAESDGKLLDARVLHGDVPTPYSGNGSENYSGFGFGVARETLSGLPHFPQTEFRGDFPLAEVRFLDPTFPGQVTLMAFNPFIPLNDRDSSLSAAFFTVNVRNTTHQVIDYTAAFTGANAKGFERNLSA